MKPRGYIHPAQASVLGIIFTFGALCCGSAAQADTAVSPTPSSSSGGKHIELAQAFGLSPDAATIEQLRGEIEAERQRTALLEQRLDEIQRQQQKQGNVLSGLHATIGALAGRHPWHGAKHAD